MADTDNPATAPDRKAGGRVVPFPMTGRADEIEKTVETLMREQAAAADRYWKDMIAQQRARMVAVGIHRDVIDDELRAFARAVFARIHELHEEEALREV